MWPTILLFLASLASSSALAFAAAALLGGAIFGVSKRDFFNAELKAGIEAERRFSADFVASLVSKNLTVFGVLLVDILPGVF